MVAARNKTVEKRVFRQVETPRNPTSERSNVGLQFDHWTNGVCFKDLPSFSSPICSSIPKIKGQISLRTESVRGHNNGMAQELSLVACGNNVEGNL